MPDSLRQFMQTAKALPCQNSKNSLHADSQNKNLVRLSFQDGDEAWISASSCVADTKVHPLPRSSSRTNSRGQTAGSFGGGSLKAGCVNSAWPSRASLPHHHPMRATYPPHGVWSSVQLLLETQPELTTAHQACLRSGSIR